MNTYSITYLDDEPTATQAFFVSREDRIIDSFDTYAEAEAFICDQWRWELFAIVNPKETAK